VSALRLFPVNLPTLICKIKEMIGQIKGKEEKKARREKKEKMEEGEDAEEEKEEEQNRSTWPGKLQVLGVLISFERC
jgi:Sec-independent protein translocase protein TatA